MAFLDRNANNPKRLLRNAQRLRAPFNLTSSLSLLLTGGIKVVSGALSLLLDPAGTGLSLSSAGLKYTNPLTTKGDLATYSSSPTRLGVGTDGQVVVADSTQTTGLKYDTVGAPTGAITFFAATSAPAGWLLCNGAAVSRTTFAALFALLGTGFGPGDGSTTFNVPDIRSRMPLGTGTGTGLSARTLAQTGGEENHVLTLSEMPSHNHTYQLAQASSPSVQSGSTSAPLTSVAGSTTGNQGSGVAHNNMPPFLVLTGIIKT